jgi:hypothetical protein
MTTPTKTPEELATAVMRKLGMIDPNKQPTAAEQSMILDLYYDKMEELRGKDLVYWTETAIPRAVFGAMVRIVAEEFAPALGGDVPTEQDENGSVVSIGNMGLRMLRRHMARDATGLPTQANYF